MKQTKQDVNDRKEIVDCDGKEYSINELIKMGYTKVEIITSKKVMRLI